MKILLVCPYFPPENEIAAVRIGKFAEFWSAAGHEVVTICRDGLTEGTRLREDYDGATVRVPHPFANLRGGATEIGGIEPSSSRQMACWSRMRARVGGVARAALFPDVFVTWAFRALAATLKNARSADIVVASGAPLSALALAAVAARRSRIPLVVDFRDPIASSPYMTMGALRRFLNTALERSVVKRAARATTVSPTLVGELGRLHSRDFELVMNGYDPADVPRRSAESGADEFRLVYTGRVYSDYVDLAPLMRAIMNVAAQRPQVRVTLDYFGRSGAEVAALAESFGAGTVLRLFGEVSHAEALQAQVDADALVLALWDDPRAQGTLSGKLFEYIGSGRPVVLVGSSSGDAADLIREGGLGFAGGSEEGLTLYVDQLVEMKSQRLQDEERERSRDPRFTRDFQSQAMLSILEDVYAHEKTMG